MMRGVIPGILAAALLGLALRSFELDRRPMHNDEAVNAVKFLQASGDGGYRYDPDEHHGPSLYYATKVWLTATGGENSSKVTEGRVRAVAVCFGVGLVLLLFLVADGLGSIATIWAGVFTAISPAMVYYSRDYIHESLLVFFSLAALASGWRYWREGRLRWAVLTGAAIGWMQATKETFVLPLAAMVAALALNAWASRGMRPRADVARPRVHRDAILSGAAAWLLVVVLFFSSFLSHGTGIVDALRTYLPWMHRAAGESPHIHPWYFYVERILWFHAARGPVWSEGVIFILAMIGAWAALTRKGPRGSNSDFLRILLLYAVLLGAVYSLIPYKTPWCLLGFWQPFLLLAGVGVAVIFERALRLRMRLVWAMALTLGVGQLTWQSWQLAVPYSADRRNPYVYAQTSPDILELASQVEALALASREGHHLGMEVVAPGNDYWPLPWMFRAFDQVGWWSQAPSQSAPPILIVSPGLEPQLDLDASHTMTGIFALRPGTFLELYVETNLWRIYLQRSRTNSG